AVVRLRPPDHRVRFRRGRRGPGQVLGVHTGRGHGGRPGAADPPGCYGACRWLTRFARWCRPGRGSWSCGGFRAPCAGRTAGGVEGCGMWGSEVEQYRGNLSSQWLPMVPGHEPLGIIEEVSSMAAARWGVEPGDRVAVEILIPCRSCDLCLAGRYMSCRHRIGSHGCSNPPARGLGPWGGFAEYIHLHPNAILHKVRGGIPAE